MSSEWEKLLQRSRAVDFVKNQKLVTAPENIKLRDGLKLLKENDISSFPLVDQNNKAIGFVDVLDISTYALHCWRNALVNIENREQARDMSKFFDTNARDIMNFSGRDEFLSLPLSASLLDCFAKFRSGKFRSHRIALLNDNGSCEKIVAMLDLIRFAANHINALGFNDATVDKLDILRTCIMIRHDNYLIEALTLLADNGISGLALVDWENKLIANFSASDLKGIFPNAFDMFYKPTIDFLRQGTETKSKQPPICLHYQSKFGDVVQTMAQEKIHRIFLTDEQQRPSHLLSCTDVVRALAPKSFSQMATSE